ncbi:MAG: glycerate kinase, partial [Acidimicrobiales bacterium]
LEDLAAAYLERYGVDVSTLPGGGAAGGLAGGLAALGARLVPGFDLVARALGVADRMMSSSLVVTAEGCLDGSSWTGKVVGGVSAMADQRGIGVLVVAGTVGAGGAEGARARGVEVVSLVERFGPGRALADPEGCVQAALSEVLIAKAGS